MSGRENRGLGRGNAREAQGVGIDRSNGCVRWSFKTDAPVHSTLTLDPTPDGVGTLFFADEMATVYAVNAAAGRSVWRYDTTPHAIKTVVNRDRVQMWGPSGADTARNNASSAGMATVGTIPGSIRFIPGSVPESGIRCRRHGFNCCTDRADSRKASSSPADHDRAIFHARIATCWRSCATSA